MAIAPGTQEFYELKTAIDSQLAQGTIASQRDLKNFLAQQEIDVNEYLEVLQDFEKRERFAKETGVGGETTFDPGKIIGAGVGKIAEDVGTLGGQAIELVAGKESRDYVEGGIKAAAEAIDDVLPKSVSYALKETFDPRRNIAEDVGAELVGFAAPAGAVTKTAKFIKPTTKIGKVAKAGGIGVVTDVITRGEDEQFTTEFVELVPEAEEYVQALAIDPTDGVAEKRLKQVVDSAVTGGIITVATLPAMALLKRGGKRLFGKVKSIKQDKVDTPVSPSKTATVTKSEVEEVADGVYRQQNQIVEAIGKINTGLGRYLTSTAALPKDIFDAAIKKQNFVEAGDLVARGELKKLDRLVKKHGGDPVVMNRVLAGQTSPDDIQNLHPDVLAQIRSMRKDIDDKSALAKDSLNLGIDDKLGIAIDKNMGFYVTRTFENFTNPKWSKDIIKGIKGKLDITSPHNTEVLKIIKDAQTHLKKQNPSLNDAEIDGLIEGIVGSAKTKDQMSAVVDMFSGQGFANPSVKVLTGRKDIDKPILELLGEVKDIKRNYVETIANQNRLIAKANYLKEVKDFAEKNVGKEIQLGGLFPLIPTETSTFLQRAIPGVGKNVGEIAQKEMGMLGTGGEAFGLNKFITTDQLHTMLDKGIDSFSFGNQGPMGRLFLNVFSKPAAVAQATETVFDHTAHMLNVYGMTQQLAANGHLFRPSVFKNATKSAKNIYAKALKNDPEALDFMRILKEKGVLDSSVVGENIKKNIDRLGEGLEGAVEKTVKAPFRIASDAYGATDDFGKMVAVYGETIDLKKAFPNLTETEIIEMAAERVRNTMPSYTTAMPLARAAGRFPLGTYAIFPAEILRTSKNIVSLGVKDLAQGLKSGNKYQAMMGFRRLAAAGAVTAGIESIVGENNEAMGISKEDERAIRMVSPDWQQNTLKVFTQPLYRDPKTGDVLTKFSDSGTLDAHQYVKGPIRAIIGKIMAGESVTQREIDDAWANATREVFSPFVSEKFLTTAVVDAFRGFDSEGKEVPYVDTFGNNIVGRLAYAVPEIMTPGTKRGFTKYDEAVESERLMGEGQGVSVSGFPNRAKEQEFFLKTGIRNNTMNFSKAVGYSIYQDVQEINKTKGKFTRFMKDEIGMRTITPELENEIYDKYLEIQKEKLELQARLADKLQTIRGAEFYVKGQSKPERFGVSEILKATSSKGKFKVSPTVIKTLVRDGEGYFQPDTFSNKELVGLIKDRKLPPRVIGNLKKIEAGITGSPLRKVED